MGMCAELMAVGPFSKKIENYLDYDAELYRTVPDGCIITRRLFGVGEGSGLSRDFAKLMGIDDPWEISKHKINISKVDLGGLKEFGELYKHYNDDVVAFCALAEAGFEFHFRPEG